MPDENDKLVESLNQIKTNLQKQMDAVELIKQTADEEILAEIEKIERSGYQTIIEVDDLQKKINRDAVARVERNTILFRMVSAKRTLEKVGNIRI